MTDLEKISPKLLHKHLADDVLLCNPKKVIPSRFKSKAKEVSGTNLIAALDSLYQVDQANEFVLRVSENNDVAAGLPFPAIVTQAKEEVTRAVPHQVLEKISLGLPDDTNDFLSFDDDAIEKFLTHHNIQRRSSSFTFVNNAEHYYFYRKAHEHVPGIMLLEAARQAIYYQLYTYSKHELGKVTVSLSELNAKFYGYGELMYPIEMVIDDLTEGDDLQPRSVFYSVSFFQRGSLIARIDSHAPVISLGRFQLARNARLFDEKELFTPLPVTPIVALITTNDMKQSLVQLKSINAKSCRTNSLDLEQDTQGYLTVIYNGKLSFYTAISLVSKDDATAVWEFGDVSYDELEILKEIIKRGFVVTTDKVEQV